MNGAAIMAADPMLRPDPRNYGGGAEAYVSGLPSADLPTLGCPNPDSSHPTRPLGAVWAVVAAALIGLVANFAMHLVNLRMQNLGIAGFAIGLSVAVQALAICVTALAAKRIIAHRGMRSTLLASSALCAAALIATFFFTDLFTITVLRAIFAIGFTFLVIASEYLVTRCSGETRNTHFIAWYTTALGAGTIAGPFLAGFTGINELCSFLVGAAILLFGAAALTHSLSEQEGKTHRQNPTLAAIKFMPAVFFAAFVFGVADNGVLSMLPVYGALNGYDNLSAVNLAVCAAIGATVLQFPIARLAADRSTGQVLTTICVSSLFLLASLPILVGTVVVYLVVALLGGLIEGIFTVGLISISRDRRVGSLSVLNACFVSISALGEVVGPVASGASIEYLGSHGLVLPLIIAFAAYALAMMNRQEPKTSQSLTIA